MGLRDAIHGIDKLDATVGDSNAVYHYSNAVSIPYGIPLGGRSVLKNAVQDLGAQSGLEAQPGRIYVLVSAISTNATRQAAARSYIKPRGAPAYFCSWGEADSAGRSLSQYIDGMRMCSRPVVLMPGDTFILEDYTYVAGDVTRFIFTWYEFEVDA